MLVRISLIVKEYEAACIVDPVRSKPFNYLPFSAEALKKTRVGLHAQFLLLPYEDHPSKRQPVVLGPSEGDQA